MEQISKNFEKFDGEIFYTSLNLNEVNELASKVRLAFEGQGMWICVHSSNSHDEYGLGVTNTWGSKLSSEEYERMETFVKSNQN